MKKVLIIDDDNNIIKMYLVKLKNSGYEPIYAVNGKEGLRLALKAKPDLIILDLAMPIMDGMSLLKQLRTDPWGKTVPVIVLTNYDTNDTSITDVQKTQPSYYLLKINNTPSEVINKIDELLKTETNL